MCELLGMCANVPTDISFSLSGLMERAGRKGPHKDGWGVVFHEDHGMRAFHDPTPGSDSVLAKYVAEAGIKSDIAISHIRQANVGKVRLDNTHPFIREMHGEAWTFAHNGQLACLDDYKGLSYQPIGTTDSEQVFCWLLSEIRSWVDQGTIGNDLFSRIHQSCLMLDEHGVFNIMLSNGQFLLVYCSTTLHYLIRKRPFAKASLSDCPITIDFSEHTTEQDKVTVIASQPLTLDETWHPLKAGELMVFGAGDIIYQAQEVPPVDIPEAIVLRAATLNSQVNLPDSGSSIES